MNEEVLRGRRRISRRRALGLGGTVGLGGLLAACGGGGGGGGSATSTATSASATSSSAATGAGSDVIALLDRANTCTPALGADTGAVLVRRGFHPR